MQNLKWRVQDCQSISFCLDDWLNLRYLISKKTLAPIAKEDLATSVQDFIINNGDWTWDLLQSFVPLESWFKICLVFPPKIDPG